MVSRSHEGGYRMEMIDCLFVDDGLSLLVVHNRIRMHGKGEQI
jgi:hypothetical protein